MQIAEPIAKEQGIRIWDIEFIKEGGEHYLRVFIDKEGGVAIEDCEAFSRVMDKRLDEEDPIAESYIFEVSSAGLERRLREEADFAEYNGSLVTLKTYSPKNGKKEFVGNLRGYEKGDVILDIDGTEERFLKKEVASVRLRVEF